MTDTKATTRERILTAADHVFGEVGFDAATTRQIAELSGVNKALLHYHFAGKGDLFRAVLDSYYERLETVLARALVSDGTPRDRFARVLDAYLDFLGDNLRFSRMVQREASGGAHLARVVEHMVPVFRGAIDMLAAAYPRTAARDGELSGPQLLVSFYGMVISYFTYSPVLEGLIDDDPLAPHNLELRRRHLHRMLDLVVAELAEPS